MSSQPFIVNRKAKIGLFGKSKPVQSKELLIVDFSTNQQEPLIEYNDWEASSLSPDGKRIIIERPTIYKGASKKEISVIDYQANQVVYNTSSYYVFDTAFNASGDKLLIVANKKKPFCYDLTSQQIVAELPHQIRLYEGDLDIHTDIFIAPVERLKGTCCVFDFKTGQTDSITVDTKARISNVKFSPDLSCIYAIANNSLYSLDRDYQIIWKKDFTYLGKKGGEINASDIFSSEDEKLLCLSASATETNQWGADYVVDSSSGEIIRQIEGYHLRGRIKSNYFGNQVLLATLTTLDLSTGLVSDEPIL
ncbi:hypothetical protein QNI16_27410 [Cytophagaceae bacterium YF14B1]|uniref:WD40 repeat domain-containing protein n=1 Tax=Xanthocytophaga flava TaxID=3048013 RepID=A0AAE3QVY5_9BACT|nr:hypothetical protein [Xanthocytophaga flavus]MDJ1484256.1 hypothetical protein [Xanthocytophaga flavus]